MFIGKLLGQNYRVVEPVGAGAMGMVYVVEHVTLKKRFAAKLLTADLARHPEAVARFETEAYAASQLDHENIVSVIDFGKTDDGCVFIIMELLRGKTLQARMDQGPPSIEEIVAIVLQVCHALAAAHAAGIVHRDMKPENIFLTQRPGGRPVVKVLDFGIAKARESSLREGRITKQGQLLGSPEYMSPEASRGDEVDPRADIYAVGVMLYELLCGEVPFRHENYLKVLQMHASQAPRPPRELAPELPEAVERLILRALEKDPRRRQPSIEALEAELLAAMPDVAQRALIQAQTPAHGQWLPSSSQAMYVSGTNPGFGTGSLGPGGSMGYHSATMHTRPRGRRGLMIALWSAAGVAAATAAILFLMRRSEAEREPPATAVAAAPLAAAPRARTPDRTGAEPVPVDPLASAPAAGEDPDAVTAAVTGAIRLRITTTPPGASATLDGKRLGRTPIDTWVASSDGDGEIEFDLRGYKSTIRSVRLDRSGEVRVSLQKESREGRESSREGRESRESRRSSSSSRKGSGSGKGSNSASRNGNEGDERAERPPAVDLDIKEGR
jgi:eukaryotic-like serine/threonine-protein kinase